MRQIGFLALLPLAAACTYNTTVHRLADAPNVPRSDSVAVVAEPPKSAIQLGTVTVRGNRNKVGAACEAEAASEAKRMGGTHVVVTPVQSGGRQGVRCTAAVWYLGAIVGR